jgi:hypothetical protein
MSAHTPGPWGWRNKSGSLHRIPSEGPYQFGETVLAPTYDYDRGVDVEVSDADAALIAASPDLADVARAYEAWEGDLILDGNVWNTSDGLPKLTQRHYDRLMELQAMRNAALAKAKGATP